jgi:hypothetical protein
MSWFCRLRMVTLIVAVSCVYVTSRAQETQTSGPYAPGIMTVIPVSHLPNETFHGPLALPEFQAIPNLDWSPNYVPKSQRLVELSNRTILRREVWYLEFAFKPLRMMEMDIPQPAGNMERKTVWYMVYRIRYLGDDLKPEPSQDAFGNVTFPSATPVSYPNRRFFPHFVLSSHEYNKQYLDRVIPIAKGAIERRERPPAPLYNSVEICNVPIPLSTGSDDDGVWGYVTWIDLDPRIDFFSIDVRGLTNAYQFEDAQGGFAAGDAPLSGRTFRQKTLRLNFWRPGDSVFLHEGEIRFGVPVDDDPQDQQDILAKYGLEERLDYLWIYR